VTLAAIRAEKAFAKLPPSAQKRVLAGLSETKRKAERAQVLDRYGDRDLRLRNRDALKAHLVPVLKILRDDVGGFDAMDWLTGHHRGAVDLAMVELRTFENTAQRLLDGAMAFDPDPNRKGRGERQLRTELVWQAFHEFIELLESVDVPVRASLGPGTRLLTRLIAYAVDFEVSVNTVKALVLRRGAK
jgi:hypothetical protein